MAPKEMFIRLERPRAIGRICCRHCSSVATGLPAPSGSMRTSHNNGGCIRKRMTGYSRDCTSASERRSTFRLHADAQVATYRELMRLRKQLSDDVVRYENASHALLVVLFPELARVFLDPTRPTALAASSALEARRPSRRPRWRTSASLA